MDRRRRRSLPIFIPIPIDIDIFIYILIYRDIYMLINSRFCRNARGKSGICCFCRMQIGKSGICRLSQKQAPSLCRDRMAAPALGFPAPGVGGGALFFW